MCGLSGWSETTFVKLMLAAKRHGARIVVHVVALNAFVHDAVTAADDGLAVAERS